MGEIIDMVPPRSDLAHEMPYIRMTIFELGYTGPRLMQMQTQKQIIRP